MSDPVDDEINSHLNDDVYTPESLAWKLLLDDEIDGIGNLLTFTNDEHLTDLCDKITLEFEILITIYLEMIFGWYKLLYLTENDDVANFKVDLNQITLTELEDPYKDKIKILGYILNVEEITDMNYYEFIKDESYCRIALRDLESDYGFFLLNQTNINPDKRFHFILNSKYPKFAELRQIFGLVKINKVVYKINFVKY